MRFKVFTAGEMWKVVFWWHRFTCMWLRNFILYFQGTYEYYSNKYKLERRHFVFMQQRINSLEKTF